MLLEKWDYKRGTSTVNFYGYSPINLCYLELNQLLTAIFSFFAASEVCIAEKRAIYDEDCDCNCPGFAGHSMYH